MSARPPTAAVPTLELCPQSGSQRETTASIDMKQAVATHSHSCNVASAVPVNTAAALAASRLEPEATKHTRL